MEAVAASSEWQSIHLWCLNHTPMVINKLMKNTKKYMVVSALMAVSFHTCAMAEGGTITYTGMITSQTCTINDGSPDFSVKLPTIAVETLMKSGETSGRTPFRIRLSNCDEDLEGVGVFFEPGANTSHKNNRLINLGTAQNVELQILNDDLAPVKLNEGVDAQDVKFVPVKNRGAVLTYFTQYYAEGTPDAGSVESNTQYTVIYP